MLSLMLSCATSSPSSLPISAPQELREADAGLPPLNAAAIRGVENPELQLLFHDHWEHQLERWPRWATEIGDARYRDRLEDLSAEAEERDRLEEDALYQRGVELRELLPPGSQDAVHLAIWLSEQEAQQALRPCRFAEWSFSPRFNPLTDANGLVEIHPLDSPADIDTLFTRYRGLEQLFQQHQERLEQGLRAGWVNNRETTQRTVDMMRRQLAQPTESWPLALSGEQPAGWSAEDWTRVQSQAFSLIEESVRPALEAYTVFLEEQLLPASRGPESAGLIALPEGEVCYRGTVLQHSSLRLSPEAIHETGLSALRQVHQEFLELDREVFQLGELSEIFKQLRQSPELRFGSAEEVEEAAREALARAEEAVPAVLKEVPETPCEVVPIPDYEAPYTTIAYYLPPSEGGERPGQYFINTHAPETRPRHEAEVLAFHEAVPGHHLQHARAREAPDLPAFRRYAGNNAYVEGWALYSERLADELELYSSPVDRMGMLSFDSWRAARLVVDSGIHQLGWTRQQAIDFMMENTPLAENNIHNEVDRYISWPGQALGYKLGQLEILELRAQAEEQLGEAFDLASFHELLLSGGAVPLPILRQSVESWISRALQEDSGD